MDELFLDVSHYCRNLSCDEEISLELEEMLSWIEQQPMLEF